MKVVFSFNTRTDLAEIVKFIAYDKPKAARKWAASIRESVSKLSYLPRIGRIVPEYADDHIREIINGPYRIVYKIGEEKQTVVIVTVHHGKRLLL